MRRLLAWIFLFGLSGSLALAAPPRLQALDGGSEASLTGVRNFRFRGSFGGEMKAQLQAGAVTVTDWPLRSSAASEVTFRRMEVYAPDAKIYRVDENGQTEVPRSTWTFASGVGKGGGSAWLAIDEAGQVRAATSSSTEGELEIVEIRLGSGHFVLQRVSDGSGSQPWACGLSGESAGTAWIPQSRATAELALTPEATEVLPTLHRATIAIDTDSEFMDDRLDNTTTATNFIASLISQMSVFYERDVNVALLQDITFLRTSSPDPYNNTDSPASGPQLSEFSNYWAGSCGGMCTAERPGGGSSALAALLSGKSTSGASGIAWVSPTPLCSPTTGYSVSQVFGGNTPSASALEAMLVAHELGHNFGSPHTHCYSGTRPDNCYGLEGGGCYSGITTCPASSTYNGVTTRGTIMSYCHLNIFNAQGNLERAACEDNYVFHTETMLRYFNASTADAAAAPNQCLFPAYSIASLTPNNGPTAGGTAVSIKGLALTGTNSVTFGGTPATSVVVVNDTTVTAVSPAHATGKVSVVVGNSSGGTATLTDAFFYANTSAASAFFSLTPCRIVDTRGFGAPIQGGSLAANSQRTWTLINVCGVPASAKAVSANVTITGSSAVGQLSFYPGNAFPLGTSTLNYGAGQTRANNAMLELATDGLGSVGVLNSSAGAVHVILDVNGYFQ